MLMMMLSASTDITAAAATIIDDSQNDEQQGLYDQLLTIQVLEDLVAKLRSELPNDVNKRQFDGGYGSRYVAAHSVGSKLMALKQAADWNSPGKKRRSTGEH